jgi:hypothetical protein
VTEWAKPPWRSQSHVADVVAELRFTSAPGASSARLSLPADANSIAFAERRDGTAPRLNVAHDLMTKDKHKCHDAVKSSIAAMSVKHSPQWLTATRRLCSPSAGTGHVGGSSRAPRTIAA